MKVYIVFMRGVVGYLVTAAETKAELKRRHVGHVWVLSAEQLRKLYCTFLDGGGARSATGTELQAKILTKLGIKAPNKTSIALFNTLTAYKIKIIQAVKEKEDELYYS